MTFSGKLLGKCIPHNHVREWPKMHFFIISQSRTFSHENICQCQLLKKFWLLTPIKDYQSDQMDIFKDFSYHPKDCWFFKLLWKKWKKLLRPNFWPIVQSIVLIGKQQWVWVSLCVFSAVGWLIVYQLGILSLSCSQYSQTICWHGWDDNACLGVRSTE